MTDPLTLVRDADPAAGVTPDPASAERMDAALDRLLAHEPAAQPEPRSTRPPGTSSRPRRPAGR